MATIYDVAQLAGVGIGTVSRVMNQRSHVKMATREKVQQAIEQLHYKPDPIARSMISKRTGSLGVIAPLFTHSFCREALQGMEAAAARLGRHLVLYNVQNTVQRDRYFSELPMYTSPLLATDVLEIARALSIKVPDALAIIDFNQSEIAEWLGLSTLQLPMDQMGEWGVRHLVDQIEKPAQSPILHTCELTFVERRTTKHLVLLSQ